MIKAYKNKAMAVLHENVSDLHRIGLIDKQTKRKFDAACLTPVRKLGPAAVRRIRTKADMSQTVFAAHLNVSVDVVSKWEHGEATPSGPAAKLLTLASIHGIDALW